jgi:tetratricopeptide (TPR) repeat protein
VVAASLLLATLVGGIVTTSWQARVAQRRFDEVRRLSHSVLFDYHDAIASLPGSTPARAMLLTDALRYLDVIGKEAGGDMALQLELASAYLRVGDVQGRPYAPNLGQTEAALASYRKGLSVLDAIRVKDPGNREARRETAMGLERIANIELRQAHLSEAIATHRRALSIREQLMSPNPSDTVARQDLSASYLYLGDVLQGGCSTSPTTLKCLQEALQYQQKALEMRLELRRENPADLQRHRDVAQAYMRIGFRLRDISNFTQDLSAMSQALENHERALEIREDVAARSLSSGRDRRDAADQRMVMAPVQAALGDNASALAGYRKAVEAFKLLSAADPLNAEARRDLSFAHDKLALLLAGMGGARAAQENFDAALACARQLVTEDSLNNEDRQTMVSAYAGKSHLAEQARDFVHAAEFAAKVAELDPSGQSYLRLEGLSIALAQRTQTAKDWLVARDATVKSLSFLRGLSEKAPLGTNDATLFRMATSDLKLCDSALPMAR